MEMNDASLQNWQQWNELITLTIGKATLHDQTITKV